MSRKFLIALLAIASVACNENKEPETDPSLGSPVTEMKKDSTGSAVTPPDSVLKQQQTLSVDTSATANPTLAGLNPEHGKPGHRCDIAVGAPLNSAPAKTTSTTQSVTPTVTPTTATTKTAPGMNPPHGQPGHRCDIAVGAPLNSTPPKPATTTPAKPIETPAALQTPMPGTKEQLLKQEKPAGSKTTDNLEPDNTKPVLQTAPGTEKKD